MDTTLQVDLSTLLQLHEQPIMEEAVATLNRARLPHYQTSQEENAARLQRLFELTRDCVQRKAVLPIVTYAEELARGRFAGGFDLSEVQTAFNILEETIWRHIAEEMEPTAFPNAFGMTSAVLGAGKEALAREYVSLAAHRPIATLDIKALFAGV